MAKKIKEKKVLLERTYVIPLKKEILKAVRYKKAKKAVKTIKIFLAKNMKVPNRDVNKIKLDSWLNRSIWIRGIKKPPYKVTVKATKNANGIVKAEFVGLPAKYKVEEAFLLKKKAKQEAKTAVIKAKTEAEEKKKLEEEKIKKEAEEKARLEKEKAEKKETPEETTEKKKEKIEKDKMLKHMPETTKPVMTKMKTAPEIKRKALKK